MACHASFEVAGWPYTGATSIRAGHDRAALESEAQHDYPIGAPIRIRYNPAGPAVSSAVRITLGTFLQVVAVLVGLLGMLLLMAAITSRQAQ